LVRDDQLGPWETKLDQLWAKNALLPAKTKRTVEVSKAVICDSNDKIRIIVVEGPSENDFNANKTVGYLEISGKQVKRDLLRGMEIDLTFELSESRELVVQAFVNPSGPEFSQIFVPTFRDVPVKALCEEVQILDARLEKEQTEAIANENYEVAERLKHLRSPVQELQAEAMLLDLHDVTDDRFKLQDRKRKIAQDINQLTSGKRLEKLRNDYMQAKEDATETVNKSGNDHERRQLHEVVAREYTFLPSTNPQKLQAAIDQLHGIKFQILRRTPAFLIEWFQYLAGKREMFNDQLQAKNLIEAGKKHIAADDFDKLVDVNGRLHNLLPQPEQEEMRYFTGIM
jgi:molecular chaperone DnaK